MVKVKNTSERTPAIHCHRLSQSRLRVRAHERCLWNTTKQQFGVKMQSVRACAGYMKVGPFAQSSMSHSCLVLSYFGGSLKVSRLSSLAPLQQSTGQHAQVPRSVHRIIARSVVCNRYCAIKQVDTTIAQRHRVRYTSGHLGIYTVATIHSRMHE